MKHIKRILLMLVVMVLLTACGKEADNAISNEKEIFLNRVQGCWVDMSTCHYDSEIGTWFEFCSFEGEEFTVGTYMGHGSFGKVINANKISDDQYDVTIQYRGEYDEVKDEYGPGEDWETSIIFTDDSFCFVGEEYTFTYIGKNIEESAEIVHQICKENAGPTIPKMPGKGPMIGSTKKSAGNYLYGPSDSYGKIMKSLFCLSDEPVEYYYDSTFEDYYGVVGDTIVMYGTSSLGLNALIKDVVNAGASEPISYMTQGLSNGGYMASYLWEVENGYLSIIATPKMGMSYRNLPVYTLLYVTDLKYLDYLDNNQLDINSYGKVIE